MRGLNSGNYYYFIPSPQPSPEGRGGSPEVSNMTRVEPRLLLHPLRFLAFGFGSGLVPKAPGTAGTLMAIPIYLFIQPLSLSVYLSIVAAFFLLGIWICQHTVTVLGTPDHSAIVWDEITGYLLAMTLAPAGWVWIVAGFVLFRFFDIVKPWPITWCDEHVHGGLGVMLDDLVAGVFAAVVMQVVVFYL